MRLNTKEILVSSAKTQKDINRLTNRPNKVIYYMSAPLEKMITNIRNPGLARQKKKQSQTSTSAVTTSKKNIQKSKQSKHQPAPLSEPDDEPAMELKLASKHPKPKPKANAGLKPSTQLVEEDAEGSDKNVVEDDAMTVDLEEPGPSMKKGMKHPRSTPTSSPTRTHSAKRSRRVQEEVQDNDDDAHFPPAGQPPHLTSNKSSSTGSKEAATKAKGNGKKQKRAR